MTRFATCLGRATRAAIAYGFAAVALAAAPAQAQTPHLASAESFAVLAGATVTNTGTTNVTGDVGVGPGGSITGTITVAPGGSIHEGDAVAAQALMDASETYDDLVDLPCPNDLTGQNLGGQNLGPGVYCFDANAVLSVSALTLTGTGPWIFQIAGSLTTSHDVNVVGSTDACNGSNVFWLIGTTASVGANTSFVGNILAQTSVALGLHAELDGRAVALAAASSVTLDANTVAACSFGDAFPPHDPFKVTGGGQINVPEPDSAGLASYGFNATPDEDDGATGHLNYLNHVSGLHVDGTVTDLDVITINDDGLPQMVRFSGTCTNGPDCTFSVTVEDNGEPSVDDRFGIAVVGSGLDETTSDRVVRNGNIQFHPSLSTDLNAQSFRPGEVMAVTVSLTPGKASRNVDAYLVLQLPDGQFVSWTGSRFEPGLLPLARNFKPVKYRAVIAALNIPADAPLGTYTWLSGLAATGTLDLVSHIAVQPFTIGHAREGRGPKKKPVTRSIVDYPFAQFR